MPAAGLQAEQLVDGINPSQVNLLLGVPHPQREIRIHFPLMHGKLPEAGDHPAPVDELGASLGATAALHAEPNGWRPQKFLGQPQIDHAKNKSWVEGAALAGYGAGAAAFAAGEATRHVGALGLMPERRGALEEAL